MCSTFSILALPLDKLTLTLWKPHFLGVLFASYASCMLSFLLSLRAIRVDHGSFLAQARRLFCELVAEEEFLPPPAQCTALVERCCVAGMGTDAYETLLVMAEAQMHISARLCCQTIAALVRALMPTKAFELFSKHLEHAGTADSTVGSLAASEWNVEHTLAMLTRALSKRLKADKALRVFNAARAAGIVTNFAVWHLSSLAFACVEAKMLTQAVALSDEAQQALLPLEGFA
eukprot:6208185-Pleurochrysis_carterae.AAC.4